MSMQNINNNIAQSNELRDLKLKIQEFIIKVDIVLITALVNFFNEAVIKFLVLHYLNFV